MIESRPVWKLHGAESARVDDDLVIEEPLEIRVRGRSVAVTMRTPGPRNRLESDGGRHESDTHDAELAAGFLLSEGLIHSANDIARIDPCTRTTDGNIINVFLAPGVEIDFDRLSRHVFSSSSCGVCGKATIESLHRQFDPIRSDMRIDRTALDALPAKLREAQACFDRTGGLHAAALFDVKGDLLTVREDIGRHNAVDKVLGHALLQRMSPLTHHGLLVSGRVSFEIIQKALAAGVPLVAAISAPSTLAVELAEASGMTVVGFLREGRMNLYCGESRIRNR